jgi:hypothetical protein
MPKCGAKSILYGLSLNKDSDGWVISAVSPIPVETRAEFFRNVLLESGMIIF